MNDSRFFKTIDKTNTSDLYFALGDSYNYNGIETWDVLSTYLKDVFKTLKYSKTTASNLAYNVEGRLGIYSGDGWDLYLSYQFMK